MTNSALIQIANRLLTPDLCAQIRAGTLPPSEIAYHFAVLCADCEAANDSDQISWSVRRLSKQLLAMAGLCILVKEDPGSSDGS